MQLLDKSTLEKISEQIHENDMPDIIFGTIRMIFVKLIEYRNFKIPMMPSVSQQIMLMLDDNNTDISKVALLIKQDPMLGAMLLKVANSSFYSNGNPISTIDAAIKRIGFQEVKRLGLMISLSSFVIKSGKYKDLFAEIWKHSVLAAIAADELAKKSEVPAGGEYIGGLLHDIGKIFVLIAIMEIDRYLNAVSVINMDLVKRLINELHIPFGRFTADKWNLPPYVSEGIVFHHDAAGAFNSGRTVFNIYLANIIASNYDESPEKFEEEISKIELLPLAGINIQSIFEIRESLPNIFQKQKDAAGL